MPETLDTIVRFHDLRRLKELDRCVFSLICQSYRPLNIILAVQRFSQADIDAVRSALSPHVEGEVGVTLEIVNFDKEKPEDARSALLNTGLHAAGGRYLGFLDYDDVLYPEAYELLTSRLQTSGAAIAFASVRVMQLNVYYYFLYGVEELSPFYRGSGLSDLYKSNFCPLHSYLIDRSRADSDTLQFDETMTMQEDYDFLLRFCAVNVSDFAMTDTPIGDYYYKSDGSNTVPTTRGLKGEELARFNAIVTAMEVRRRTTKVSDAVQRSLGIEEPDESATIRKVMDRLKAGV